MKTTLKKNRTLFIVLISVIGLTALFTVNYIRLNRLYPNASLETYQLNQPVRFHGLDITAKKFQMLSSEALIQQYKIDDESVLKELHLCPTKVILITVSVKSSEKSEQRLSPFLTQCGIQSFTLASEVNEDLFLICNSEDSYKPQLKSGEETTVVLPFDLGETGFSKENWANINSRKFDLVVSTYPVKKSVHLN